MVKTQERKVRRREANRKWLKKFRAKNPDHQRLKAQNYLKDNPQAQMTKKLRNRLNCYIQHRSRRLDVYSETYGCTKRQLIEHFEKGFKPGMTWENYGKKGWCIDHIVPCALFDLTKDWQVKSCFKWENLQPSWPSDNCIKSKTLEVCPV